ncbi:hypothetical protein PR003_g4319 [Phytophthora rubi]|uniref:Tc1-like transposase DDE domain-containing protein n=1 Tax=Phytophthora rubi TaxID=129364 RepID=A0A6A4FML4_9STRA|nr:hypothetical protein PR003_g4319 [Phytophthora rubi]
MNIDLLRTNKIVIVTDNAPSHNKVENLTRLMRVPDGIINGNKLMLLRLEPYIPMQKGAEACSSQECRRTWRSESKSS